MRIKKTFWRLLISAGIAGILGTGFILSTSGCGDDSSPSQTSPSGSDWQNKPLEYKLARLDEGNDPPQGDVKVARFKSLLGQLSGTYKETEQQIGDMTVNAQDQMKKEGVDETLLDIMEDMNQVFAAHVTNQSYAEYVSAYVVLREKGYSRDKSVEGIRGTLKGIGAQ